MKGVLRGERVCLYQSQLTFCLKFVGKGMESFWIGQGNGCFLNFSGGNTKLKQMFDI